MNDIDSLCFFNYMEHIKKTLDTNKEADVNIIGLLATFKLECWEMADNLAGDNKLLGL